MTAELNTYIETQLQERDEKKNSIEAANSTDPEAVIKSTTAEAAQINQSGCLASISIFPIDYKEGDTDDVDMDLQHLSISEMYDIGREPSTTSVTKNSTLRYLYFSNIFSLLGLMAALTFVSIGVHFQIQQPASNSLSLLGTIIQIIVVLFLYELFRSMSLSSLYKLSSELLNSKAASLSEKMLSIPADIQTSLKEKGLEGFNPSTSSKPSDPLLRISKVEIRPFSSKYYVLGFTFEKYAIYYFFVLVFCLFWIIVGIIPYIFAG
jgi:hypothetical protein